MFEHVDQIHSLARSASGVTWAFGTSGAALRHHSAKDRWFHTETNTDAALNASWASTAGHVLAVGGGGVVLEHDGGGWVAHDSGTQRSLHSVWGRAADDVYAAGDAGVVVHYDGAKWTPTPTGRSETLFGIGGRDAAMYVVGESGLIMRRGAGIWLLENSGVSVALNDIELVNGVAIAVGDGGTIVRRQPDGSWTQMDVDTTSDLNAIDSESGRVLVAGGAGVILELVGGEWRQITVPFESDDLHDIWTGAAEETLAGGADGFVARYDDDDWYVANMDTENGRWSAVHGTAEETYVVGSGGRIIVKAGGQWGFSMIPAVDCLPGFSLQSVWVWSSDVAYAVGYVVYEHWFAQALFYDGARWRESVSAMQTGSQFEDVYGVSPDNVAIVGHIGGGFTFGLLSRFDGVAWKTETLERSFLYEGVWGRPDGRYFAVGATASAFESGCLASEFEGQVWAHRLCPIDEGLHAVIGAANGNPVAAGAAGSLLRFNGQLWKPIESGTSDDLVDATASPDGTVYVAGANGTIITLAGDDVSQTRLAAGSTIAGVWARADDDVFVVESANQLWRLSR